MLDERNRQVVLQCLMEFESNIIIINAISCNVPINTFISYFDFHYKKV